MTRLSRSAPSIISASTFFPPLATNAFRLRSASSMTSLEATGLAMKPIAPELSARSRESSVETTHTGMCRVERSAFSRSRMRQPCMSGRKMSSVITEGWNSLIFDERARRRAGHHALEALPARRLEQHPRERQVVLHDQDRQVVGLDLGAVVARLVGLGLDFRLGVDRLHFGGRGRRRRRLDGVRGFGHDARRVAAAR